MQKIHTSRERNSGRAVCAGVGKGNLYDPKKGVWRGGSPPNAAAHAQLQQKLQQQNLQRQREKFNMACRSLWRPWKTWHFYVANFKSFISENEMLQCNWLQQQRLQQQRWHFQLTTTTTIHVHMPLSSLASFCCLWLGFLCAGGFAFCLSLIRIKLTEDNC